MRIRAFMVAAGGVATMLVVGAALLAPAASGSSWEARATLKDADGTVLGKVWFDGDENGTNVKVVIEQLPAGTAASQFDAYHGLHVHATGVCVAPFTSAGGHWDTTGRTHGLHSGDLPSVLVGADGKGSAMAFTGRIDPDAIDGRAIILHALPDNFGNVPTGAAANQYTANSVDATNLTATTGNAGARIGCGVIAVG